ncbi:MAG: ketopantoate reductase family protein [Pseudomonadota bacterium]
MRTAILGAGALGSVIGALLARGGRDVALWDIDDQHLTAVNANGLILDGPDGRDVVRMPALRPEHATETPDLIILLTKTTHTETALDGVAKHIDAGAHVLTLQNGLGNAERVAQKVPKAQVLYGCTLMPGRFIAPGHVATQGDGFAVFRPLLPEGTAFAECVAANVKDLALTLSDGTDIIIWQKAAFNCAMNACAALTGARVGELGDRPDMQDLLHGVAAEVTAVARAREVPVDDADVRDQIAHALAHHTEHKPSMLQDLEAGRTTEIDSLCAEVSRQAGAVGVPAPLNEALAALVTLRSDLAQRRT